MCFQSNILLSVLKFTVSLTSSQYLSFVSIVCLKNICNSYNWKSNIMSTERLFKLQVPRKKEFLKQLNNFLLLTSCSSLISLKLQWKISSSKVQTTMVQTTMVAWNVKLNPVKCSSGGYVIPWTPWKIKTQSDIHIDL